MGLRSRITLVAVFAAAMLAAGTAAEARQAPVFAQPSVSGSTVTFNWSATANATAYRIDYGFASGIYAGNLPVGNVTTFTLPNAPNGVFFLRVVATTPGGDVASNEVTLQLPAPPPTPVGLSVSRNGLGIVVSWQPGTGGGAATSYTLLANAPGYGNVSLPTTTTVFSAAPVPVGDYTFQVLANNAAGSSAPSAVVNMTMPSGGACDPAPAPTVTTSVFGGFVTLSWTPIGGASSYLLSGYQNGTLIGNAAVGGTTNRFSVTLPQATWRIDVAAVFSCGSQGVPGSANFVIDESTLKMQPREPDPAPGGALPGPSYLRSVVEDIAARYPADLRNSCVEHGGNNRWMFRLVAALRERDKRWGLNWKRGNVGDMSQDVVAYNFSADPDEGTRKIRAWDVIGGHCGSSPGPNWAEITSPAPPQWGNGAMWPLQPYIQAGWTP